MRLFFVIIFGLTVLSYSFMWYQGATVPAWHVLIWVVLAFVNELDAYLQEKMNKIAKSLP